MALRFVRAQVWPGPPGMSATTRAARRAHASCACCPSHTPPPLPVRRFLCLAHASPSHTPPPLPVRRFQCLAHACVFQPSVHSHVARARLKAMQGECETNGRCVCSVPSPLQGWREAAVHGTTRSALSTRTASGERMTASERRAEADSKGLSRSRPQPAGTTCPPAGIVRRTCRRPRQRPSPHDGGAGRPPRLCRKRLIAVQMLTMLGFCKRWPSG